MDEARGPSRGGSCYPSNIAPAAARLSLTPEDKAHAQLAAHQIGIVGMNAAVANAVFKATGKRIRDLPIRAERLL